MDKLEKIIEQNEVIISLLGRLAFKKDEILEIVTKRKQNPDKYIEGYNACNGNNTVSQLASIVGVSQPNMTEILKQWEEIGIIFEVDKKGGKFYRKRYPL